LPHIRRVDVILEVELEVVHANGEIARREICFGAMISVRRGIFDSTRTKGTKTLGRTHSCARSACDARGAHERNVRWLAS
jgi:hypothetical protein